MRDACMDALRKRYEADISVVKKFSLCFKKKMMLIDML